MASKTLTATLYGTSGANVDNLSTVLSSLTGVSSCTATRPYVNSVPITVVTVNYDDATITAATIMQGIVLPDGTVTNVIIT